MRIRLLLPRRPPVKLKALTATDAAGQCGPSSHLSGTTKLPANDSGSFPFRFPDVHPKPGREWHREQFFEVPIIGVLSGRSQDDASGDTAAFHQGLNEMGFVGGRNVALQYRWAEGRNELLPDLAADLVRLMCALCGRVSVMKLLSR